MNEKYKVKIYLTIPSDKKYLEFEGIIGLKDGKIFIKPHFDNDNYKKMFERLWEIGDVKIKFNNRITITKYHSLEDMFKMLKKEGFEIKWEKAEEK